MWFRGDRVWFGENKTPATVLRHGAVWSTLIFATPSTGHWYTGRAKTVDLLARDEDHPNDEIADEALDCLP